MPEGIEKELVSRVLPGWCPTMEGSGGQKRLQGKGPGGKKPFDEKWMNEKSVQIQETRPRAAQRGSCLVSQHLLGASPEGRGQDPPAPRSPPGPEESKDEGRGRGTQDWAVEANWRSD